MAVSAKSNVSDFPSWLLRERTTDSGMLLPSHTFSGNFGNALSSGGDLMDQISRITAQNNSWSAQQAQRQMDYQTASQRTAMDFNASEAAKNRQWQEYMSNTAHQREVEDLRAAGLNPILSASGGNGAAVTSGATAAGVGGQTGSRGDTDTSGSMALVNLLGSMLQANTQLQAMQTSALSNLAVADKYTEMSRITTQMQVSSQETVARLASGTQLSVAQINSLASRYAADSHANASQVAAAISAAAQRYASDNSYAGMRHSADMARLGNMYSADSAAMYSKFATVFNGLVNLELQRRGQKHDFDLKEFYPSWDTWSTGKAKSTYDEFMGNLDDFLSMFGFGRSSGSPSSSKGFGGRE